MFVRGMHGKPYEEFYFYMWNYFFEREKACMIRIYLHTFANDVILIHTPDIRGI